MTRFLPHARRPPPLVFSHGLWSLDAVTLYVISDLHLDERGEARLFEDERQGRELKALCERVVRDDGAGPRARRALPALLDSVRKSNPVAFEALTQLSQRAQLTVVPGNHDHQLGDPEAGQLLASHGVRARIERSCARSIGGKTVVLQHGHELDEGNERPGGSGEVMTNALHQAVIPFLRHHGPPPNVRTD